MNLSTSGPVPTFVEGAQDLTAQAAVTAQRRAFRTLHERGCFVIPNPWNVGSARHASLVPYAEINSLFAAERGNKPYLS